MFRMQYISPHTLLKRIYRIQWGWLFDWSVDGWSDRPVLSLVTQTTVFTAFYNLVVQSDGPLALEMSSCNHEHSFVLGILLFLLKSHLAADEESLAKGEPHCYL